MARVPEGAELIENRMSGAPGIRIGNIFILAGVPHIATRCWRRWRGTLEGGGPLLSRTIGCWGPESEVADILREVERAASQCQIGSYPFFREGKVGADFVVRSTDEAALDACWTTLPRASPRPDAKSCPDRPSACRHVRGWRPALLCRARTGLALAGTFADGGQLCSHAASVARYRRRRLGLEDRRRAVRGEHAPP